MKRVAAKPKNRAYNNVRVQNHPVCAHNLTSRQLCVAELPCNFTQDIPFGTVLPIAASVCGNTGSWARKNQKQSPNGYETMGNKVFFPLTRFQ